MANVIRIKRGVGKPDPIEGEHILQPFELGFDTSKSRLYIRNDTIEDTSKQIVPVGGGTAYVLDPLDP